MLTGLSICLLVPVTYLTFPKTEADKTKYARQTEFKLLLRLITFDINDPTAVCSVNSSQCIEVFIVDGAIDSSIYYSASVDIFVLLFLFCKLLEGIEITSKEVAVITTCLYLIKKPKKTIRKNRKSHERNSCNSEGSICLQFQGYRVK